MTTTTIDDIMRFMTNFKESVERKIQRTNENLEEKIETMNAEMKGLNTKIDDKVEKLEEKISENERKSEEAMKIMEGRLGDLEQHMNKSAEIAARTMNLRRELRKETILPTGKGTENEKNEKNKNENANEKRSKEKTKEKFRSTFAQDIERELSENAGWMDRQDRQDRVGGRTPEVNMETEVHATKDPSEREKTREREVETKDTWERLEPRRVERKIRKPMKIMNWFGNEPGTDSSSSDEENWEDVNRKGKKEEKIKRRKERRMRTKAETAFKASKMLGIGPVNKDTRAHFERITNNDKEQARQLAVKEMLAHFLDFSERELTELGILETKEGKDDFF